MEQQDSPQEIVDSQNLIDDARDPVEVAGDSSQEDVASGSSSASWSREPTLASTTLDFSGLTMANYDDDDGPSLISDGEGDQEDSFTESEWETVDGESEEDTDESDEDTDGDFEARVRDIFYEDSYVDPELSSSDILPLDVLWPKLGKVLRNFVRQYSPRKRFGSKTLDAALVRVKSKVYKDSSSGGIASVGSNLFARLLTELQRLEEGETESAPDYIQQGVSGLWKGFGSRGLLDYRILIEDSEGNVLGFGRPENDHCIFYGRKVGSKYDFKDHHEDRTGMLAGKGVLFWYDQDSKCMNKWPRHKWYRIPNAKAEYLKTGLLNPPEAWTERLGKSGNGRVLRGAETYDGTKVAIKIMNIVCMKKDVSERRFFEQEAALLYSLDYKYLIACYDTFVVEGDERTDLHLVMELADGNLENYIHQLSDKNLYGKEDKSFLEEDEMWQIFLEVLLCVNFLHTNEQRILHRDISLCNILRVRHKECECTKCKEGKPAFIHKLADLGVARVRRPQTESTRTNFLGKFQNYAPEQNRRSGSHTEKTDIFQLGLVVHHCCNLRHPYENQFLETNYRKRTIERINKRYSDTLNDIIASCLYLSPNSRPNTVELLANPMLRRKGIELGFDLPHPIAIVGLIKLDFDKPDIAVFNKGKLRLEYPPRYYLPTVIRRAVYPPVLMKTISFGSSSYEFHENVASKMIIQFKCVCVSKAHDWNLQLTLRHLSSIVGYEVIDGHWHSPINIMLNGAIASWKFQPRYWRDYAEDIFELPSEMVFWDERVNALEIQLSEDATTKYWLQGCKLEVQRRMLDVEDLIDVAQADAMNEIIWIFTKSVSIILAIALFLTMCARGIISRQDRFSE